MLSKHLSYEIKIKFIATKPKPACNYIVIKSVIKQGHRSLLPGRGAKTLATNGPTARHFLLYSCNLKTSLILFYYH